MRGGGGGDEMAAAMETREKGLQGDGARKMTTKEETAQVQEREMPTKMSVCSREKEGKRETN